MRYVLMFLIFFIAVYLFYLVFIIRKNKEYNPNNKKLPMEIMLLANNFKVDFKNLNYKRILHLIALINASIISITVILVGFIEGIIFQILVGFLFLLPITFFIYSLLAKYLRGKVIKK